MRSANQNMTWSNNDKKNLKTSVKLLITLKLALKY